MIVEQIIDKQITHKHYDRTVKVADFCRMVTTGEGQEDNVKALRLSENETQKGQRVRITKTLTKFISAKIFRYMTMLKNIEDIKIIIDHPSTDFLAKISGQIEDFSGNYSLEDWLFQRTEYYERTDPNALLVIEFNDITNIDGTITRTCYPVEVKSKDILHITKNKGNIEEVVFTKASSITIKDTDGKQKTIPVLNYHYYQQGISIVYERVSSLIDDSENPNFVGFFTKKDAQKNDTKEHYKILQYKKPSNRIVVLPFGKRLDPITDNETYVSIIDPASAQLEEIIYTKSEFDLSLWLHVFQRVLVAGFPCKHSHEGTQCEGGKINGANCTNCNGRGTVYPTTSQDVTHIAIPDGLANIPDLSKLIQYVAPPESVPNILDAHIEKTLGRISAALFDTNIFSVNGLVVTPEKTATEIITDYSKLYNVFTSDATHYSMMFVGAVEIIAAYMSDGTTTEGTDKLIVIHKFPKDFKFDTLDELILKYQQAKSSGIGYDVLKAIKVQVIQKLYPDNKAKALQVISQMDWLPFADKSEGEIQTILLQRDNTDFQKVLYDNFKEIFDDIEHENDNPMFFEMRYSQQKETVKKKVDEYIANIKVVVTNDPTNFFPNPIGQEP